jgi:hypothetical protein
MTNKFLPRLAAIVFALFSAVLLLGTFLFINQAFAQETSPQGASTPIWRLSLRPCQLPVSTSSSTAARS